MIHARESYPHAVPVRRERQDSRGIFVRFSEQKMPIELANTPDPAYVCAMLEQSDNIQNLIDDFAFLDDWEDRYMHVIELGKSLAPLSDAEKNDVTKVKGCVSQVWLVKDVSGDVVNYRGDSDAHIVKGLVAVVLQIFSGRKAQGILDTDVAHVLSQLGLSEHLSPQRSNGLNAMIQRIKNDAMKVVNA